MNLNETAIDELFSMAKEQNATLREIAKSLRDIAKEKKLLRSQGEWMRYDDDESNTWECSVCHDVWQLNEGTPSENHMKYCPKCGSRMTWSEAADEE